MDAVTICNMALAKCGELRIQNLDETSKQAILCRLHYQPTRQRVLRAHPWNCAIRRAQLAALADPPLFDWDLQYELPVDCLRVLRLQDNDPFRIEGRRILTDATPPLKIVYISDIEDANLFSPMLAKVLSLELAIELSYNLTGVATHAERLAAEAARAWVEARAMDAQEGTPETYGVSEWLDARIRGCTPMAGEGGFRAIEPGT